MKRFFGFALADSMFTGNVGITRREVSVEEVKALVAQGIESCCNPSHAATIAAMRSRFGIDVSIPETPPRVALGPGDSVVIMGVRGLPRLTDRHEYAEEEIAKATFSFTEYTIIPAVSVDEVYEKIVALSGQQSKARVGYTVWVPAIANGGLKGLLEELAARGWEIIPSEEN